jgi:Na+-transporting NADH:ubiquinone oxidoreductase subunit NqrF
VFIGGGAGMAPLRAMIRTLLAGQGGERIHFWYGARSLKEAPYIEEMEQLAGQHPNFSWHLVLSDEAQNDDALLRGLVHEVAHDRLLKAHQALADCEFYLCGPPAMLKATRELLSRLGGTRQPGGVRRLQDLIPAPAGHRPAGAAVYRIS